jgi:hypothetical protein
VILALPVIFAAQVILGCAQFRANIISLKPKAFISLSHSENITPATPEYHLKLLYTFEPKNVSPKLPQNACDWPQPPADKNPAYNTMFLSADF